LYSLQNDTFSVSVLRDLRHAHISCNTGKNVHVKFDTEFEGYVWIVDTEQ